MGDPMSREDKTTTRTSGPRIQIVRSPEGWTVILLCGALLALPIGTSPFTILGVSALAAWIFTGEIWKKRNRYLREARFLPVLALVLLPWIGLIYSPDPGGLGLNFAEKTYYWLYALAAAGISNKGNRKEYLVKALFLGLLLNAVAGFLQAGGVVPTALRDRYTGFGKGYNTLSILLVLGSLMASYYFKVSDRIRKKLGYLFLMLVFIAHLSILQGRGGYFTFVSLSPIIAYNLAGGKRLWISGLAFIALVGVLAASPMVRERVKELVQDTVNQLRTEKDIAWGKRYHEDDPNQRIDRIYMWRWAIELFLEHPFRGVGTGGFYQSLLAGGGGRGMAHPHNNFLHMAVSYGILGVFALAWLFWVLLKTGWRNRGHPVGFFILSGALVVFVGGLVDTHVLDAGSAFLLAIVTGLVPTFQRHPI